MNKEEIMDEILSAINNYETAFRKQFSGIIKCEEYFLDKNSFRYFLQKLGSNNYARIVVFDDLKDDFNYEEIGLNIVAITDIKSVFRAVATIQADYLVFRQPITKTVKLDYLKHIVRGLVGGYNLIAFSEKNIMLEDIKNSLSDDISDDIAKKILDTINKIKGGK